MIKEAVPQGMTGLIARHELLIILAVAPLMIFPNRASVIALVVVGLVWFARRSAYGRFTRPGSMNLPEILLFLMALIGYVVSVDRQLSEPKLWGIFLQTILYFSVLNGLHHRRDIHIMAMGMVGLTIAVAILGLIGTDWNIVRLAQFPQLYDRLPQLIRNLPDSGLSPGQDLFHPREVGATMGMLLPFTTAILLFASSRWLRLFAALSLLIGGFVLLLSQALMGLFGLLVGWAIVAIWWRRWMIAPIGLMVVVGGFIILRFLPDNWQAILLDIDNPIGLGVVLRLDIWSRALAMITDMPYTGVGLNTYPLIQTHFYIGHLLGPEPHAHNLFLQTAVDLGLPGLIAFIWLIVAFYRTARQASRRISDKALRAMIIGAVAGVSSYVAGGLLDAMTLGAKPVAALSIFLGLVGALHWLYQEEGQASGAPVAPLRARLMGIIVPGLMILFLVFTIALWPAKLYSNLALIPAHQAIYIARRTGILPLQETIQAAEWLPRVIQQDEANPELYGAYGSLLAWQNGPAAALESLSRRVELDGRNPYAYAPFLAWQDALTGASYESEWEVLLRIYRPWQSRFPERAESYSLLSLVYERHLDDIERAVAIQRQALDTPIGPRSLTEYHHSVLAQELGTSEVAP